MKKASNILEWIAVVVAIAISFLLLFKAFKSLPVGTVYAVFTGLGAGGIVLSEILLFGEPFSIAKIAFIGLIFVGVIGLKRISGEKQEKEAA